MHLKPGARLRSAVCGGQIVVVRAPDGDVDLRFGGRPVRRLDDASNELASPAPDLVGETPMGKRYAAADLGVEVLVTQAGQSLLSVGDELLDRKDAKVMPSSD